MMANTSQQIFEFRGVDSFYFAEVLQDDENGYVTGTPIHIPVQEVGKSVDAASEAHYYDNKAMIVVNSESADTVSLTIAPPSLDKLSTLIGKSFDEQTGMMVDSPRQNKYFAITYRTKGTDGGYRYVTRLKGTFNIPEETNQTENDGTDTNNTTIEFTGIYTEHEFTKGKYVNGVWEKAGVKGIVVDARYGLADLSTFFTSIQTPDSITPVAPTPTPPSHSVTITNTQGQGVDSIALTVGGSPEALLGVAVPNDATITWTIADTEIATIGGGATVEGSGCAVTAVAEGSTTITASITVDGTSYTDTCAITVNAE